MSAPSSSRIPLARVLLLVAACAIVAAGCTVPGSSRLQGPPEDLPPSLDLVTADVLGYTLYHPDPRSKHWAGMEEGAADDLLDALHAPVFGGMDATLDWIGEAAGMATRELDLDGKTETAQLYFADVDDRDALEAQLGEAEWVEQDDGLAFDDATLWTRKIPPCVPRTTGMDAFGCVEDPPGLHRFEALALTDDAIVAARTTKALKSLLRSADEYAVPERKAMSEFTVEAAKRVPVAFVFRADLLRTQVRRPFQDDPALLEFARWATDSNVLVALRDGWVGLAPAIDERSETVRVVGAAEWVPDLAPDITLGAADPGLLTDVGPGATIAVAFNDPGQHLRELVRAITSGAGQYVTEQDVVNADRVELLPLLDELDGDASIGYTERELRIATAMDETTRAGVVAALEHAGVDAVVTEPGDGTALITVPVGDRPVTSERSAGGRTRSPSPEPATPMPVTAADFAAAGTPPRAPFAWFRTSGRDCITGAAGWMTFDGTDRITFGMSAELEGRGTDDPVTRVGTCTESLAESLTGAWSD